jgi:hypothetical protein
MVAAVRAAEASGTARPDPPAITLDRSRLLPPERPAILIRSSCRLGEVAVAPEVRGAEDPALARN